MTRQSPPFIVDNTEADWRVRNYLKEWCGLSRQMDIATGYFEIGSLLCLEEEWCEVDKIRLLMGDEVSRRTKSAFQQGIRKVTPMVERISGLLDNSIEGEKIKNDFLKGVPAIVEAIRAGKIECRIYRRDKFHAKAYITHGRAAVLGSFALVGSSNFTYPGLNDNVELNVQIQGPEVGLLQEWYERHWAEAEDVTAEVLRVIERQIQLRQPFEVWFKALHEYLRGHELTPDEWDRRHSVIFPLLARYQQDAYKNLVEIGRLYGGAFLCDGVGLGKTYVGLMLVERMVVHEGKRVVLFAPKAAREDVWEPDVEKHLSELNSGFVTFIPYNHTDLQRRGKWPRDLARTLKDADVVIVDEAHHFRNPGIAGTGEKEPSRYRKFQQYLHQQGGRPKELYFLTATPVNNSIHDFRHILELVTNAREDWFAVGARNLGIHNLRAHFVQLERRLIGHEAADGEEGSIAAMEDLLQDDRIFRELVVQRSRSYVRQSLTKDEKSLVVFPEREAPRVAAYGLRRTYGALLDSIAQAFDRQYPLFVLSIYYPLHHWIGPADAPEMEDFNRNRQRQVVALIRTQFLKRFESSAKAFEMSCWRLLKKILAWVEVHATSVHDKGRLQRWKIKHAEITGYVHEHQSELWPGGNPDPDDQDLLDDDDLAAVEVLDPEKYNINAILDDCFDDLNQIVDFLKIAAKVDPSKDDKLKSLERLLKKDPALQRRPVIVFSEFADTARYVEQQLVKAGIQGIERIDGNSTQKLRSSVIHRFAPFYNRKHPPEPANTIRVLIATDILAEGLNLQDADRLINYDLHWNPVRLMQRIGRVDRRLNPEIEEKLLAARPELRADRGKVIYWNFLPPEELDDLLRLYNRVNRKTFVISRAFGIEGRKLLHPDDEFDPVKEFKESYEGTVSEDEALRLEYQQLVIDHPELAAAMPSLPLKIFSGRESPQAGVRAVFFCFRIPHPDPDQIDTPDGSPRWSEAAGETVWLCTDPEGNQIADSPKAIANLIRCQPETPRHTALDQETLSHLRGKLERKLVNERLRPLQAPIGVTPVLKCWMEVS